MAHKISEQLVPHKEKRFSWFSIFILVLLLLLFFYLLDGGWTNILKLIKG